MKNKFLLREEFKEWLITIGQFPIPSANSYLSYVAGADRAFIIHSDIIEGNTNLFELLRVHVENGNYSSMDHAIIDIVNDLYKENIDIKLNTPISTISKWRSALFQYREFLYDYVEIHTDMVAEVDVNEKYYPIDDFENINSEETKSENFLNTIVGLEDLEDLQFTKSDLYKNFRFRIITQDRFYKPIFYPISFIKRLLYSKDEKHFIDKWVENLLDNINLHLAEETIKLKDIAELKIDNGKIYVKHNDGFKLLYTKLSDNINIKPFDAKLLKKIAIDHDKPLYDIMVENKNNLETFDQISIELKKFLDGTINSKKLKIAYNHVLNSEYVNNINIENLKKELELLSSKTSLQLMDSKENLIKRKN